jgi:hypothetical protein
MRQVVAVGIVIAVLAASLCAGRASADSGAARKLDFNRDIRPILSNSCYACHGPDSGKRKGDPPLRLDTNHGLFDSRDGSCPVVPKDPDNSLIYMRISSDDPDVHMPPPKSNRPQPTKEQIALIKTWIEQGAEWKNHWAYIAPTTRPAVPDMPQDVSLAARNPIDHFVAETLDAHHLQASAEADRVTLIRRLSFDLTGLPPTPQAVEAFVKDDSPDAYDKVVDQMLASPHFGERMAVWWLDLVRYADTIGYHSDNPRQVSPYRDYVIQSFNKNKHFDQFTIEQLAGDLLPKATNEQKIASGYNRLLQTTGEGGAQAAEYVIKYECDRVRNVSSVWLGATMGCSQCHDHKYDPYSQKDFYRMAAFFADIKEAPISLPVPELMLPTPEESKKLADLDGQIAALKSSLDKTSPQLEGAQAQWEADLREHATPWTVVTPTSAMSTGGTTLVIQPDGSVLASGQKPAKDQYFISLNTTDKDITAIRIEALPDQSLPANGPGRAPNGNFVLSSVAISTGKPGAGPDVLPTEPVVLRDASASYFQVAEGQPEAHHPSGVLNPDKAAQPGWAILGRTGRASNIVLQLDSSLGDGKPTQLLVALNFAFGESHAMGRMRFSVTSARRPVIARDDPPPNIAAIIAIDPAKRSPEQLASVAKFYRSISPLLEPVRTQIAAMDKQKTDLVAALSKTLISVSEKPRDVRILARGNWQDTTGEIVTPAVPHFLGQIATTRPSDRATRLDLANWLVARDNPLTSRVIVNDLWRLFYGQGICKPLDDLGSQGAPPSHPDLLDWLAIEFMDSGWDMKHMIRLMVTSETYRQSSNTTPEIRETDPYNVYLTRQGRFRLDAEFVRDNALAISGLLVDKETGPSVKPYQPDGLWDFLNFPKRTYDQDHGDNLYRRGLYTHWQRTFLNPELKNFDASTREECVAERARSNTPQQALTLLNDPTFVEAARVFAEHVLQCGGSDPQARLDWAFERALSRSPHDNESKILLGLLDKQLNEYRADPKSADALVHVGEHPLAKGLDETELAAWTNVTRAILNLHETINRL